MAEMVKIEVTSGYIVSGKKSHGEGSILTVLDSSAKRLVEELGQAKYVESGDGEGESETGIGTFTHKQLDDLAAQLINEGKLEEGDYKKSAKQDEKVAVIEKAMDDSTPDPDAE